MRPIFFFVAEVIGISPPASAATNIGNDSNAPMTTCGHLSGSASATFDKAQGSSQSKTVNGTHLTWNSFRAKGIFVISTCKSDATPGICYSSAGTASVMVNSWYAPGTSSASVSIKGYSNKIMWAATINDSYVISSNDSESISWNFFYIAW